ncbi:phospholipase A1-like [Contarinia nasturtii]|uniref:phospholipase A1-like n=1 Tax=Contarinia nasturtii TaxID=265458 RepID=UPI0012D439F7|nr:phospholipase A1-like [Contarinia nasturtii]
MLGLRRNKLSVICVWFYVCVVYLSECNGQKEGDPVTFACITSASQNEFFIAKATKSIPSTLIDVLNNGKGLSLFFHGVSDSDAVLHGFLFNFATKWFKASDNNICIVSCPYVISPKSFLAKKIDGMWVKWLEYVAKMASDLINKIGDPSKVDVSGFGYGAHFAGRTCQFLSKNGKKIRHLLALDPIKTPPFGTKIKDTIRRNDADYVQVIHTSREMGIWEQIGDIDVYVKYEADTVYGPLNIFMQ